MRTNQVIGLLAVSILATFALQEYRISKLREEILARDVAGSSSTTAGNPSLSSTDQEIPAKTKSSPEVRPAPAVVTPPIITESFASNARKMWENPAGKSMMSQGAKIAVAMMYQDFIDGMKLSREEADYFKNLLGREVSDQQELGMKMMEASPDEREKLAGELKSRGDQTQEEIKKFLNNDDDFKAFNGYKDRIPERQQLDGIRNAMATKGVPLDPGVEAKLVDVMYRARTEAKSPDLSGPAAIEELADGNLVENFERSWKVQQEYLLKESAAILSPEQAAAFQEYRQQMREMQMMQMKMAEQMMPRNKDGAK